jgi:hypothetical protein
VDRMTRFFPYPLLLALAVFLGPAMATDTRCAYKPREGTVVLATAKVLTMRERTWDVQASTKHRYFLARNALVTCDGMLCSLQDLKPGQRVRVTAQDSGAWSLASRVEALDEESAFPVAIATRAGRTTNGLNSRPREGRPE